jgi:hypothetical protein
MRLALFWVAVPVLCATSAAASVAAKASHVAAREQAVEPVRMEQTDEKAQFAVELMVLHASNSKKGIDKRIGNMPELEKPPFSSYDSYELLATQNLDLKKGEPKTYRLPNGRILKTDLNERLANEQFRISASINQPKGKAFLPLLEVRAKLGQSFIVAGQTYKSGILVLVLKVVKA